MLTGCCSALASTGSRDWSAHPIAVRHPFCFYYGHMASFAKIRLLPDMPVVRVLPQWRLASVLGIQLRLCDKPATGHAWLSRQKCRLQALLSVLTAPAVLSAAASRRCPTIV